MSQKIYFQNGDIYEGYLNSSKELQGQGKYQYSNGSYFKGEFIRGKFNGKGIFYDQNTQTTIQGDFKNSLPNGNVTIQYKDQSTYEGQIMDGKKNGQGTYNYPLKHKIVEYKGQFQNDQFEGQGTLIFRDGTKIQGEFQNGKCNGKVQITKQNSKLLYIGNMQNNKKNDSTGKASMIYPNGDKYTGSFINDLKSLEGKMEYKDGTIYEGEWHEDKKHGKGKLKFYTGEIYTGQFQNGQFQGFGKYEFKQPDIKQNGIQYYEGYFEEGKANGDGKLIYFNTSSILTGKFSNNTKHGLSKLLIFKKQQDNGDQPYATYQGEFVYNTEKSLEADYGPRK